jgi:outer membrane murein-binding lipoprotein Lpp
LVLAPMLIGTVALGSVLVACAIRQAARDQIAAINRGTEVAINEARHAQHHVEARRPHPPR